LSHGTALTWSAAEILIELSPAFLTDLSFSSATECERHPDLAGSDHRLKPRLSPRVSGGGLLPYGGLAPNADLVRSRHGTARMADQMQIRQFCLRQHDRHRGS
jgi:hypothetical protein